MLIVNYRAPAWTKRFYHKFCQKPMLKSSPLLFLQCSNESVFTAVFHPMDANLIVTCGKSHINFWTVEGNTLTKRQGVFEVQTPLARYLCPNLTFTSLYHPVEKNVISYNAFTFKDALCDTQPLGGRISSQMCWQIAADISTSKRLTATSLNNKHPIFTVTGQVYSKL